MPRPNLRRIPWHTRFIVAIAVLIWFLFGWNRFSLELVLEGKASVSVEYGEEYSEPGCRAMLRGSKILQSGIPLELPLQTEMDEHFYRVGKHEIGYHAAFLWWEAAAFRTVRVIDIISPEIFLVPDPVDMEPVETYVEAGFSAWDNVDGDITDRVIRTEEDDRIIYAVVDSSGNPTVAERPVKLLDTQPPEILLVGGDEISIPIGMDYEEPGYTAWDKRDGDLTDQVVSSQDFLISRYQPGEYHIEYSVNDSSGNTACVYRKLDVVPCTRLETVYPGDKTVYLTFDDGPCTDTGRLLDVLKKYGVHATFFVVDTGCPEMMRRIVEEGHSIGIHTRSHNYRQIYSGEDSFFNDILSMQDIIRETTGVQTWLLRFPGGSSNTISHFNRGIMSKLTEMVEEAGFRYFDWNVDSEDAGGATTRGRVLENIQKGILECPVSVVLQHDIHSYSVDAVEEVVKWGIQNGYHFLPLDMTSPEMHHPVLN